MKLWAVFQQAGEGAELIGVFSSQKIAKSEVVKRVREGWPFLGDGVPDVREEGFYIQPVTLDQSVKNER